MFLLAGCFWLLNFQVRKVYLDNRQELGQDGPRLAELTQRCPVWGTKEGQICMIELDNVVDKRRNSAVVSPVDFLCSGRGVSKPRVAEPECWTAVVCVGPAMQ